MCKNAYIYNIKEYILFEFYKDRKEKNIVDLYFSDLSKLNDNDLKKSMADTVSTINGLIDCKILNFYDGIVVLTEKGFEYLDLNKEKYEYINQIYNYIIELIIEHGYIELKAIYLYLFCEFKNNFKNKFIQIAIFCACYKGKFNIPEDYNKIKTEQSTLEDIASKILSEDLYNFLKNKENINNKNFFYKFENLYKKEYEELKNRIYKITKNKKELNKSQILSCVFDISIKQNYKQYFNNQSKAMVYMLNEYYNKIMDYKYIPEYNNALFNGILKHFTILYSYTLTTISSMEKKINVKPIREIEYPNRIDSRNIFISSIKFKYFSSNIVEELSYLNVEVFLVRFFIELYIRKHIGNKKFEKINIKENIKNVFPNHENIKNIYNWTLLYIHAGFITDIWQIDFAAEEISKTKLDNINNDYYKNYKDSNSMEYEEKLKLINKCIENSFPNFEKKDFNDYYKDIFEDNIDDIVQLNAMIYVFEETHKELSIYNSMDFRCGIEKYNNYVYSSIINFFKGDKNSNKLININNVISNIYNLQYNINVEDENLLFIMSIFQIRQAIELKIKNILGIDFILSNNKILKIEGDKLIDFISKNKSIELDREIINIDMVRKIHNWTQCFIHSNSGNICNIWKIHIAHKILINMFNSGEAINGNKRIYSIYGAVKINKEYYNNNLENELISYLKSYPIVSKNSNIKIIKLREPEAILY